MSFILVIYYFVGFYTPALVNGYTRGCDFNQTIFAPEGTTATFQVNFTSERYFLRMRKTSGSTPGKIAKVHIDRQEIYPRFREHTWETGTHISSHLYSDDILNVRIDLSNVSMKDNGTYILYDVTQACFIFYVMEIKIEPSNIREENEPVLVYAHPHASLIKRPLANATMTWLLDGEPVNQTASYIQQDGYIWISTVGKRLDGKNVTYLAMQDDGRIIEINATLKVKYGPSHPLTFIPKTKHYNLVSGTILPDITCSSECNPPCNISWENNGEGNVLSLGVVTTEDTGEYTCTATRSDGRTVEQMISLYVTDKVASDNSHITTAIACLATVQALTLLAMGICTIFNYKRKAQFCCHHKLFTEKNSDNTKVIFSASSVQGSENDCYEELKHDTRNANNTYGEVNLAVTGDRVQLPADEYYENTNISNEVTEQDITPNRCLNYNCEQFA